MQENTNGDCVSYSNQMADRNWTNNEDFFAK